MSRDTERDIAFIRALAEVLETHDLAELEVEREYGEDDELKVRLTRRGREAPADPAPGQPAVPPLATAPGPLSAPPPPSAFPAEIRDEGEPVTSPMVGTAYLSPEPGAEAFVQVGDAVAEGQTVLIIEAMKTMNQIPAPRAGILRRIYVANAEPVEYGAPLFLIA